MIQQQAKGGSLFTTLYNLLQISHNNAYNNASHHHNPLPTTSSSTITRQFHHSTKLNHGGSLTPSFPPPLAQIARNARIVLTRGLASTAARDSLYVVGMLAATPRIQHVISTQYPGVSDNADSVCASAVGETY